MSFDERDKLIITIICSLVSFIFIVIIICFILWLIIRRYRSKSKHMNSNEENNVSPISTYHRQQYQHSQKFPSTKVTLNNKTNNTRKKKKRRLNTNESTITFSFDPPHLMNQNVKNLGKLLSNESTLTANSWHYEETFPTRNCYYKHPSNEPVYASSSTVLTSISNLAHTPLQITNPHIHFLTELDHVLRSKQEQRSKHPLKYSQSCRQTSDLLPFDYYRSISPPSIISRTNPSNHNSLEPIYICTNKYSNTTLARKARLAQLRDDTAILY